MSFPKICATFAAFLCLIYAPLGGLNEAEAGGYAILEQSPEGTGVANAGATAGYSDGSAVFYNPGAMSRLERPTVSAGGALLLPHAEFDNRGSHTSAALGGAPVTGDNGPDGGVNVFVPSFYAVQPLNHEITLGVALNIPFGLETQYSNRWVGRYSGIKSKLGVYSVSPAASYAITDDLSFGAAVNVVYANAEITNAIDFGAIGVGALGPERAAGLGLSPQNSDGYVKVTGDDFGVGATAGLSYSYAPGSRLGLSYRSPIKLTLSGDADFTVPPNAEILTSTGSFVDSDAEAGATLPDSISGGFIHQVSEKVSVLSDIQWTHWTWFDKLVVDYASQQPDSVVVESWDNSWRYSLGAEFRPTEKLILTTGVAYDQDPISDKFHRTPRLPSNDRYWLAVGAGYRLNECAEVTLTYAHVFVPDAESEVASPTGDVFRGEWELSTDIVALEVMAVF